MAGNGKMDPLQVPRLLEPILERGFDYVQGSRYLTGGDSPNLPFKRALMIKAFTFCVNRFLSFKGTDVTCGFRAYRTDIFERAAINIDQDWLGRYEMEYYIHYRVIKAGLKVTEVPVSMTYPPEKKNYSKIKAGSGWWSMIRPWVFLILKIKK
jgi:dolichol-phosphate mannosyltransferase